MSRASMGQCQSTPNSVGQSVDYADSPADHPARAKGERWRALGVPAFAKACGEVSPKRDWL